MRIEDSGNYFRICDRFGNRHCLCDTENCDLRYSWTTVFYDEDQLFKVGYLIYFSLGVRKQPRKPILYKAIFDFIIRGTRNIMFHADLFDRNMAKPNLSQDFILSYYCIGFDEIRSCWVVWRHSACDLWTEQFKIPNSSWW